MSKKIYVIKNISKKVFQSFIISVTFLLLILCLSGCGKGESFSVIDAFIRDSKLEMQGTLKGTNDVSIMKSVEFSTKVNDLMNDRDHFPHLVALETNDDASLFQVTFDSQELTVQESVLRMSLYMLGADFQREAGFEQFVTVDYVDKRTGEVFATGNSDEVELKN